MANSSSKSQNNGQCFSFGSNSFHESLKLVTFKKVCKESGPKTASSLLLIGGSRRPPGFHVTIGLIGQPLPIDLKNNKKSLLNPLYSIWLGLVDSTWPNLNTIYPNWSLLTFIVYKSKNLMVLYATKLFNSSLKLFLSVCAMF